MCDAGRARICLRTFPQVAAATSGQLSGAPSNPCPCWVLLLRPLAGFLLLLLLFLPFRLPFTPACVPVWLLLLLLLLLLVRSGRYPESSNSEA
jgi:hypothetical protein